MRQTNIWLATLFLFGWLAGTVGAWAAEDLTGGPSPEVRAEIQYAEALQKLGMPEYAGIVIERLSRQHPEAKPFIKVLKMQSLISRGQFEAVLTAIAKEADPNGQDAWAMRLSLADGYYAWGKYPQAEEIYASFFKAFPAPTAALKEFYINSAYKYAQMEILLGKDEKAIEAYENILKAGPAKHIKRQIMSETAELMLKVAEKKKPAARKALFAKIEKLTDDILWVQDVWFGKAIVIKAHVLAMKGDVGAATKLIDDYRDQLKQIDEALREQDLVQLSPMAECRYLLGEMMWTEAQKLLQNNGDKAKIIDLLAGEKRADGKRAPGALQHLLNVFIGYPSTKWALDAGELAEKVEQVLTDRYGARIKTQVTAQQMEKVRHFQFKSARTLFNQNQFKNAIDAYIKVLNRFPEGATSVAALGELARCYVETGDDLMVDVIVRYMGERFGGENALQSKAGDQVLRVGGTYAERGNAERKEVVYNQFFDDFSKHPMAAALLYQAGTQAFTDEDYAKALTYYERLVKTYPDAPISLSTLKQITYCYLKMGDQKRELVALKVYAKALQKERAPGHDYIRTLYRMATGYQKLGDKYLPAAIKLYSQVIALVKSNDAKYSVEPGDAEKNQDVLEGSIFYKGVCYSLLKKPEAKVKAFQVAAIKTFQELVADYPKSRFAPSALNQVGTLWTILEEPDKAQQALKQLQADYPRTPEAQNALFMLGKNLLDLGMRDRAVNVFREMFSGQGQYSNAQILTAGNELSKAGEYEISLQAFDRILATTDERAYVEQAMMGKGLVMVNRGEYAKAVDVLQGLLDKYAKSGMTIEASLQLSRAYGELAKKEADADQRLDLFNKAVLAMTKARQYDKSAGFRARSDVIVAQIMLSKAQAESEFGSAEKASDYRGEAITTLQGLIMLGNLGDPEVRPHIEEAYGICIPLLLDAGHYQAVVDDAEAYIDAFPKGRYLVDVRRARSKARTKLALTGETREKTSPAEETTEATATLTEKDAAEEPAAVTADGTGEN